MNVSASKVNDLLQCSMIFYLKHILKLPDRSHVKTRCGSLCHNVVEYALKPKREALLRAILDNGFSLGVSRSVQRYIGMYGRTQQIPDDIMQPVESMISLAFTAIKPYIKRREDGSIDYTSFASERRFELKILGAIITGFIDFIVLTQPRRLLDFKTKGARYTKIDAINLLQGALYQLYMHEAFGDLVPADFVMLRFPATRLKPTYHLQTTPAPTEAQLDGLRYYVFTMFERMNGFTVDDATSNYCADSGFCTRVCQLKNPFEYISVKKRDGTLVGNYYPDSVPALKADEISETLQHLGCPRFHESS